MYRTPILLLIASLAVLLTGCTGPAEEVRVEASEYTFMLSTAEFKAGQAYRFVVSNRGGLAHELMVMPVGVTDHSRALLSIHDSELTPGKTVTRTVTFRTSGTFEVACHVPGHYEGGMKTPVTIA